MAKFIRSFDDFACEGNKIICTIDGITFQARIAHDPHSSIDDDDSHNIDQSVTGCDTEQQAKLLAAREAWKQGDWFYCGVIISARHNATGAFWDHLESLWGIKANYPGGDNSYLNEVANELLASAVVAVRAKIRELFATVG